MLSTNRDFKRSNKANMAVRGCIYSKISSSSIAKVKELMNEDASFGSDNHQHILKLLDISQDFIHKSTRLLGQSQVEINISTLDDYAIHQFKSVQRAEIYKEDWKYVKTTSKFIVTEDMVNFIDQINTPEHPQSG